MYSIFLLLFILKDIINKLKELLFMEKKILATVGEKEITNLDVESALKA